MPGEIELSLVVGDLRDFKADAVLLKHAQGFHGVDRAIAEALAGVSVPTSQLEVAPGVLKVVDTHGALGAPKAAFLGTERLGKLGYREVRQFGALALTRLAEETPGLEHLATTIHGANFGLDEDESVLSLVGGFIEAFQKDQALPPKLSKVSIVELNARRAQRLIASLERGLSSTKGVKKKDGLPLTFTVTRHTAFSQQPALATAGSSAPDKPHAFVAMPFTPELEDVFHYGIQGPVRAAGLLCERVDQAHFDGPIIQRIRERIESAKVVIADLSMANANVYLEVGYAWGRGRPTVLLVRDLKELKFDVASYRCVVYRSIRELEQQLSRELERYK